MEHIKNKLMRHTSLLILILMIAFGNIGCDEVKNVVSFTDLNSTMEVSLESDTVLVFRAFLMPNSFLTVNNYNLSPDSTNTSQNKRYILSFFWGNPKSTRNDAIIYTAWAGIRAKICQTDVDFANSTFLYRDSTGIHEIVKGDIDSWKNKVTEFLNGKSVNDSVRLKTLSDI